MHKAAAKSHYVTYNVMGETLAPISYVFCCLGGVSLPPVPILLPHACAQLAELIKICSQELSSSGMMAATKSQ